MTDSSNYERKTTKHLITVDIDSCELLLELPQVQKRKPIIKWRHNTWQHKTEPRIKEIPLSVFLDVPQSQEPAFVAFMRTAHVTLQPGLQILTVRVHEVPNCIGSLKMSSATPFFRQYSSIALGIILLIPKTLGFLMAQYTLSRRGNFKYFKNT